jgi:tRNA (guanine9-N1)-methyltransferase
MESAPAPAPAAGADAPPLSKRARKRAAREAQRLEEKRQKKEKNHAQARDREAAAAAAAAAADALLTDDQRAARDRKAQQARDERLRKRAAEDAEFEKKCASGCRIVIDCGFESLMTDREARSSSQQIMYCYGANRRAEAPARLLVVGLTGRQAQALGNVSGVESWRGASVDARPLEDVFPDRSSLVYLTAESDTVLEEVDAATTYVIGGFVDRNRHKGATHAKALQLGVRTARLPIGDGDAIVLGKEASRVLAVNHVFELMVRAQSSDWAAAAECLPGRKKAADK